MTGENDEKPTQQIEISPSHIYFDLLTTTDTANSITFTNLTEHAVGFKIKTNAPHLYQVRPISGVIPPKESIQTIVVMRSTATLAPELVAPNKEVKHKFLVECTEMPKRYTGDTLQYLKSNEENRKNNEALLKKYKKDLESNPNLPEPQLAPTTTVSEARISSTLRPKPATTDSEYNGLFAFSTEQKNKINNLTLVKDRLTNEIATINQAKAQLETRIQALIKENQDLLEVSKKKGGSNLWFYLFVALFVINLAVVVQYFMDS